MGKHSGDSLKQKVERTWLGPMSNLLTAIIHAYRG